MDLKEASIIGVILFFFVIVMNFFVRLYLAMFFYDLVLLLNAGVPLWVGIVVLTVYSLIVVLVLMRWLMFDLIC